MYVCICNALTDYEIGLVAKQGARTVDEAYAALGTQICCGKCRFVAQDVIDGNAQDPAQPVLMAAE
jgi:bacterioferritin-associated ferredoxin